MAENVTRVPYPEHPDRCQGVLQGQGTQCLNMRDATKGSKFCPAHMARSHNSPTVRREAMRTYELGKWNERKNKFADDEKVKSLREEIGILRMMIEEQLKACVTENDLIINSDKISNMVLKLEKLVVSCNTLETKLGLLLDKSAVIQLASVIVEIISEFVIDAEARSQLSDKIMEALMSTVLKTPTE
jgi:hypothetical protein